MKTTHGPGLVEGRKRYSALVIDNDRLGFLFKTSADSEDRLRVRAEAACIRDVGNGLSRARHWFSAKVMSSRHLER